MHFFCLNRLYTPVQYLDSISIPFLVTATLLGGSVIKYGCVQLSGDIEQPDVIDILPLQVGTNFSKIYKINFNPYFA